MVEKTSSKEIKLTVVVPVYNEVDALSGFLPELMDTCESNSWQIIIVNDGSTDGSTQLLTAYQDCPFVRIIHHKVNRGYGGAIKSGIINVDTSHLVTIDSDGQHSISDIQILFQFSLEKDADLVVGDRSHWKRANPYREFGKWLIRKFTRILMPLPIRDLNSGFKLYRTELAKQYLSLCPDSMAFSDVITLAFISQRNLVIEHSISIQKRQAGKSAINIYTAFETIIEILNLALLFDPLRVFLPVSMICTLLGIGWGLRFIVIGRGVSTGAMLAIILGAISFMIGLLASQLSAIRIDNLKKNRSKENMHD